MNEKYIQNCDGVDMKSGMRDCWILTCEKNHVWRYYEINIQPELMGDKAFDCGRELKNDI